MLDVPVVKVDKIDIEVDDLDVRVALLAKVRKLLNLKVGAYAHLGEVELKIEGVEAQALLKARLDNVNGILERVLLSLDRNPELLEGVGHAVEEIGGGTGHLLDESGDAVEDVGEGAGQALPEVGKGAGSALGNVGEGANQALGGVGEGAKQALPEVGKGANQGLQGLGQGAAQGVEGVGQGAGQAAQGLGQGAGQGVQGVGQGVQQGVGQLTGQQGQQQQPQQQQPQQQQPQQQHRSSNNSSSNGQGSSREEADSGDEVEEVELVRPQQVLAFELPPQPVQRRFTTQPFQLERQVDVTEIRRAVGLTED